MSGSNEKQPLLQETKKNAPKKDKKKLLPGDKLSRKERTKLIEQYYLEQDNLKELYEHDNEALNDENRQQYIDHHVAAHNIRKQWDKRLAAIVFLVNLVILAGNFAASFLSGSYSVISAFVDSAMDITSSVIMFISLWAIKNTNFFNYPRGRGRLELLAVIICSVIMGVANIMMIIQSVESIINDTVDPDANVPTIIIIWSAIMTKFVLMIVCYQHGTPSSRTLAMAFCGAFVGDHFWKYADPVGAIVVCSFIAFSWFSNAFDQIPLIAGLRAEKEHISRILKIAITHDEKIKFMDHIMVYHVGEKELVELHIVLDENLPLKVTHDIAESLEKKIKALDFVERAFVHVDYRIDGIDDGS
ncbi:hypothetical protein FO519_003978 [Halicephalobus sp. NKZ332]|nr:hypothetical protein FO519_003978 [Halicephalobus sp. NKZ332]